MRNNEIVYEGLSWHNGVEFGYVAAVLFCVYRGNGELEDSFCKGIRKR